MPIPLTDLDDRSFADLMAQARALIPALHPQWTDHNPSDPGIALVELLAWLTEMLIFQVNEIPDSHTVAFLRLLNGPDWAPPRSGGLENAVSETLVGLRERYRAATPADYEYLVTTTWPGTEEAQALGPLAAVRRARCVPRRDLTRLPADAGSLDDPTLEAAHVSVVVLPEPVAGEDHPTLDPAAADALARFLEPRRILTTRHHVVGPGYVPIGISADLALTDDAPPALALATARDVLRAVLSPVTGGPDGAGWPFGRAVYTSEMYAALEAVRLLDYAENVVLTGPLPESPLPESGNAGLELDAHELPRLSSVSLTGYDSLGRTYPLTWSLS